MPLAARRLRTWTVDRHILTGIPNGQADGIGDLDLWPDLRDHGNGPGSGHVLWYGCLRGR